MRLEEVLVQWYQENKRILPWRETRDPYAVWISEIMLQQTRIEAVLGYYKRFMEKLPDIRALATVSDDELLKLWQGLGYYNRARNLKKAAIQMMNDYHGEFPHTYEELRKLPGIGEYTAGAIASICFQEKVSAVDGNVLRVMTRVFSISKNIDDVKVKREIATMIEGMIPSQAGDFNEGLMELGETICLPNATPKCHQCPISSFCSSYLNGNPMDYPIRSKKEKQREENYTLFLYVYKDEVAIQKRSGGLLKDLYEFPSRMGHLKKDEIEENIVQEMEPYKHVFTHIIWNVKGYMIEVNKKDKNYEWVTLSILKEKYALPTAFKKALKALKKYFEEKNML